MQFKGGFTLRLIPLTKKNVFSNSLKRLYDKSCCLRFVGRWCQTRGSAALKALSLKLVRVRLTRSVRESAERSLLGRVTRQQSSVGNWECAQTTPGGLGWLPCLDTMPHWKASRVRNASPLFCLKGPLSYSFWNNCTKSVVVM